jgi:hypothetical protein
LYFGPKGSFIPCIYLAGQTEAKMAFWDEARPKDHTALYRPSSHVIPHYWGDLHLSRIYLLQNIFHLHRIPPLCSVNG